MFKSFIAFLLNSRVGQVSVRFLGRPGSLRFRLAWEALGSFALKATNALVGFLTTVLLARMLGAQGYGIYAYALSLITLLALPVAAGLPKLLIRETSQGLAQGRPDLVRGAWQWSGRVVALLSLVVIGAGGPLLITWQGGLASPSGQTMAWALVLVPLMALGNLRGAALRGLKRVVLGQLPEFAFRPGLFLLLVGGLALWNPKALSPPTAMMLRSAASLLAFLVGAWLLWVHTPDAIRHAQSTVQTREWLVSSLMFALLAGFGVLNRQISTVLLGLFTAPEAVGRFRVAVQVSTLAAFGLHAVNTVVGPRFAEFWVRGEKARLQRLVTRSAQVVLLFNAFITGMFVLAGRPFFHVVFGQEFDASYGPLLILLVGQTVNSAVGSVAQLLNMTGHEQDVVMTMALAVPLNFILCLVLIPSWSIQGAAMANAVSMIFWNVLLWWRVRQRLGIISLAFHPVRRLAA